MIALDHWWIFSRPGFGRRHLNPLGIAWTVAAYLLLGLATGFLGRWLHHAGWTGVAVLLAALTGALTLLRVWVDGEWLRLAAWFTGAGWLVVSGLLAAHPACSTVVYLGDSAAPIRNCPPPYQDFTAGAFVTAWLLLGVSAAVLLTLRALYRWFRRDPLRHYRDLG